jgi:hypothetical protein
MKRKFSILSLLAIAIVIFFIVFLPGTGLLPGGAGYILIFFMPIALALHIFEEFVFPGGGEEWFKKQNPQFARAYTDKYFFRVNAFPLILATLTALGVFDYNGSYGNGIYAWFVFLFFFVQNGIFHLRANIKNKQYGPGLITSIVLYFPLAVFSLVFFLTHDIVNILALIPCLAISALIQPVIDRIKKN